MQLKNASSFYFGKIPTRGDFIKSEQGTKIIALLDNWAALGMELLIAEPDWKNAYDQVDMIDFLFIGTRKKQAIFGHLLASSDASMRRFPFIAATLFELGNALSFLPLSALALEPHAQCVRGLIQDAVQTQDAATALANLNDSALNTDIDWQRIDAQYMQYLASSSIDDLAAAFGNKESNSSLQQMILALGYLLQPMLNADSLPPHKGLSLPLPRDPISKMLAKSFWLDLVSSFLTNVDFEMSIFSCEHFGLPKLFIIFNGVPPAAYQLLFDEPVAQQHLIDITQSNWVDDYAKHDIGSRTLSSYLHHGDLKIQQATQTFRQCFVGM